VGDPAENVLPRAVGAGHYFSLHAMARSSKVRKVVELIPEARALTESDGHIGSSPGLLRDLRALTPHLGIRLAGGMLDDKLAVKIWPPFAAPQRPGMLVVS